MINHCLLLKIFEKTAKIIVKTLTALTESNLSTLIIILLNRNKEVDEVHINTKIITYLYSHKLHLNGLFDE